MFLCHSVFNCRNCMSHPVFPSKIRESNTTTLWLHHMIWYDFHLCSINPLVRWVNCSWPLHGHIFLPLISCPPPDVVTRSAQMLLYCCLAEFDTEADAQAAGKTQWAADSPSLISRVSTRGLRLVHASTSQALTNAGRQGVAWTWWRGAGSQRLWGLLLWGPVTKKSWHLRWLTTKEQALLKLLTFDRFFYGDQGISSMWISSNYGMNMLTFWGLCEDVNQLICAWHCWKQIHRIITVGLEFNQSVRRNLYFVFE